MSLAQIDERSATCERPDIGPERNRGEGHRFTNQHGTDDEYRVERGDFVAVVQPHANEYSFSVRDIRRERPTIHGYGVDFPHAVSAVTQLLDALTGQ